MLATFGANDSRGMFFRGVATAFLLCLLEGIRLAATSVVDERNEGTLGLMLLTRLRGEELLLGKLLALAFFSLQTLMVVVPVLCVSMVFGGVSSGEIARAGMALAHALVLALTCGLLVSVRSRTAAGAIITTFIVMFMAIVPFSLMWQVNPTTASLLTAMNPMTPIWGIPDLAYDTVWGGYWISIFLSLTVALVVLRGAGRDLAKSFAIDEARSKAPPERDEWAERTSGELSGKERAQWFSGNPIEWLALRNMGSTSVMRRRVSKIGAALVALALLMMEGQAMPWVLLIGGAFGFIYSVNAAMTFARARQTNEIELWLTTPLTLREIVDGHICAMRKTFLWPGLILIVGWAAIFYGSMVRPLISTTQSAFFVPGGLGTFISMHWAVYVWPARSSLWGRYSMRCPTWQCGSR